MIGCIRYTSARSNNVRCVHNRDELTKSLPGCTKSNANQLIIILPAPQLEAFSVNDHSLYFLCCSPQLCGFWGVWHMRCDVIFRCELECGYFVSLDNNRWKEIVGKKIVGI